MKNLIKIGNRLVNPDKIISVSIGGHYYDPRFTFFLKAEIEGNTYITISRIKETVGVIQDLTDIEIDEKVKKFVNYLNLFILREFDGKDFNESSIKLFFDKTVRNKFPTFIAEFKKVETAD